MPRAYRQYSNEEREKVLDLLKTHSNQSEVARLAGVPLSAVRLWASGKPIRSVSSAKRIFQPKEGYSSLSPAKAYLLGVLAGDGCIAGRGQFGFRVRDREFAEAVRAAFAEAYGLRLGILRYDGPKEQGGLTWCVTTKARLVVRDLDSYFDGNTKSKTWSVPQAILKANRAMKALFLRGLFDSDGHASKEVLIGTGSFTGAFGAAILLRDLGITWTARVRNDFYKIVVRKQSRERFMRLVRPTIERKRA